MQTRIAHIDDTEQIATIHLAAFPTFFLSSLGRDFLCTYYSSFIKSREGVVLVAEHEGKIVGFAATAFHCHGFNRYLLLHNMGPFFIQLMRLLFGHPLSIIRLARNMKKTSSEVDDKEDYSELYSIGVDGKQQGLGIGCALMKETIRILKDNNISQLSLTTDADNNDKTIAFYQFNGFSILYEFITYPHRKMYRFIKNI